MTILEPHLLVIDTKDLGEDLTIYLGSSLLFCINPHLT